MFMFPLKNLARKGLRLAGLYDEDIKLDTRQGFSLNQDMHLDGMVWYGLKVGL